MGTKVRNDTTKGKKEKAAASPKGNGCSPIKKESAAAGTEVGGSEGDYAHSPAAGKKGKNESEKEGRSAARFK
jgi:hypothetical protein